MKHFGKAGLAARKFVNGALLCTFLALAGIELLRAVHQPGMTHLRHAGYALLGGLIVLAALFIGFTLYFFRDPEARVPAGAGLVVSPGHGTVDVIDELEEPAFMGGRCRRISTFLSVFNVHVQNTPVGGEVRLVRHTPGKFLNALAKESAAENENVLVGFAAADGRKVGVRLIAGLIARRILPWVREGETVARGERMSLIQFGSRVDVYLPLDAAVQVKLGDKVVGGETVLATLK
jgi:phosphatidylserine decarboxylase